ncbi:eukaryotic translation initiation factor 5b [Moniliophthora roreri MCA 2997]|uniref:Eukaryotic translation initiation factor 5B n=1 Tax=Moniliophthora roreri (strain MCA 2997) TaxID=1381753 RepID=V2Y8F5_MONRO|nr:eukaryotic translation initiation factor 5b [Moniliophthora roreri MCA 2997]
MAPKNKGKKGKKADDDDFWEKAGESVANNNLSVPAGDASDDDSKPAKKSGGFAALMTEDTGAAAEEEEDFGGLMSAIKASSKKKEKKKTKKEAPPVDFDDEPAAEDAATASSRKPVEMTAEELADEEWGPVKEKGKKGKKGKGKKGKVEEPADDEEDDPSSKAATAPPPKEDGEDDGEDDGDDAGGEVKILSKKEKEKLKKEREKAKKKAQAAAKKAAEAETPAAPTEQPPPPAAAETKAEDNDEEADEADAKSGSKKKKKKKAKKDDEPAPAPAPAAGAKKKGGISALKAMMEEKKRLEEEARRAEEEERRRIEEEERKAAEEEKRKEEEKQRRKEKEKAKRELAKKEGRLLTKKQKEERAAAEMRKQALLASGVQVEGLQQGGGQSAKKVNYGARKKKGPAAKDSSPAPESRPETPAPATPVIAEKFLEPQKPGNGTEKDDWDASSEEEQVAKPATTDVKDSWDASSDEEEEKPAAPSVKAANGTAKTIPTSKAPETEAKEATPTANVKPAPSSKAAEEESEEEEESSSSDSESSSDSSEEDSDSSDEELSKAQKMAAQRKAEAAERRAKAHEAALAARNKDDLRSPICCILGHVDTGKTKLLDKIRQTNVQEGEAGGITQQIGATYFPVEAIKTKTAVVNKDGKQEYKVPGLLVIDTPGHESFTNLRSRGSSLCNIAILVVDIMHGLEAQTLESLRLLRDRKTPFIVALNKIDRLYGWQATPDNAFQDSLAKQTRSVQREFEDRVQKTTLAFAEEGLNAVLYYENKNFARNVSLVPTSAHTGEGVPDMIMLLVNLTQQRMSDRLMYLSELECTVLEVKVIEGLGTTVDVVLSNGILREGEKIVVCGLNGPIVTQVRALLTPQPLREMRIKGAYVHHKEVKAALGVKIVASDLEKAIAGSRLLVCGPDDDEDDLRDEVMSDLTSLLNSIDKSGRGVCVQASTLGSLEALLDFLKVSKIPVSGINIGPVHKKDVMRAATMLEKARELACILCFDVTVDKDAERMAEEMGIRLFKADIIYHLFDKFTAYNAEITEAKRRDAAPQAVWPCRLKTIAAFCKRDPIILGVDILDGSLRVGTPLAVVKVDPVTQKKEIIDLGKVTSLEINHKAHDVVKKSQAGAGVAVKIEHAVYQSAKMFGRHFDDKDEIMSHITRQSIDVLKASFRADVSNEEWALIKALKPRFNIQ